MTGKAGRAAGESPRWESPEGAYASAPDHGLKFTRITKSFGGTRALEDVSLSVGAGEVVALLGENGAGKSTLIKILGGIHHPDSGSVTIDGAEYRHHPSRFGEKQAVAFIHQDLGLVEWMTVAENMALALGFARRGGLISWRRVEWLAAEALARVHCEIDPAARVHSLTRTEKSLVAIARALAVDCRFLVLDEPTASLPAGEVAELLEALRRLRGQGVGMIYVSHRLPEIFEIADRVVVLRDGVVISDRAVADTSPERLVREIVGDDMGSVPRTRARSDRPLAQVRGLRTGAVGPVSFDIGDGEILGFAGLRGAGQESISRAIFGIERHDGDVMLDGRRLDLSSPQRAMAAGLGLVARDRLEESVAPGLSTSENFFLNPCAFGRRRWEIASRRTEAESAIEIGRRVRLVPNDPDLPIEQLSGGNQQKLVIGRWLQSGRRLLICEDPTAGVDIGARTEVYTLLNQTAARGVGILIVSTDFEEVAHICHRALVFAGGRIVESIGGNDLTVEALMNAALAGKPAPQGVS